MGKRLPQLDGLRTLAIALVIAEHTSLINTGYVGVDIFFVLSGYLITTILLNQRDSNRWSLRTFYLRRLRRLGPALAVLLGAVLVAAPPVVAGNGLHKVALVLICGSYVSDFVAAFNGRWLGGLAHIWSLAVEEQFYLLWPLVLYRLRRVSTLALVGCLMLAGLALGPPTTVLYLPFTRGGIVVIGCLLALSVHGGLRVRAADALGLLGLLVVALVVFGFNRTAHAVDPDLCIFVGIGSAALIVGLVQGRLLPRLLSVQPLAWLGQRSYAIYLWQMPISYCVTRGIGANPDSFRSVMITALGSVLIAAASYEMVERRFTSPSTRASSGRLGSHPDRLAVRIAAEPSGRCLEEQADIVG